MPKKIKPKPSPFSKETTEKINESLRMGNSLVKKLNEITKKKIKPKATLDRKAWDRIWRKMNKFEKENYYPRMRFRCFLREEIQRIVNAELKKGGK